jgi:RNA polymerase sigma-70 factor (ECF subfamily)
MSSFAEQVARERQMLLKMARRLLRNQAAAEDAVSETLLAALERPESFRGQSTLRTWMASILRNKIVDHLRRQGRECAFSHGDEEHGPAADAGAQLEWIEGATASSDPQERLSRLQFITQLDACLKTLPPRQGHAFYLRNGLEHDMDEICDEMGISINNLAVMLHRARQKLRTALHPSWSQVPG